MSSILSHEDVHARLDALMTRMVEIETDQRSMLQMIERTLLVCDGLMQAVEHLETVIRAQIQRDAPRVH